MARIGIWRRRKSPDSDEFVYGVGDYDRTYETEDEARDALDALVKEVERFPSPNPDRAYKRLREAGHPLFRKVR